MKYFVLRPSSKDAHGKASIIAMQAYADDIECVDPERAQAIREWALREANTPKQPE